MYVLRLRASDADGLEGLSAERAFAVRARPQPPLLIEPAANAVATSARPAYRWAQPDANWHYRLQIIPSSADAAAQPFEQVVTGAAGAVAEVDLPAGLYRWRVASIEPASGRPGRRRRPPAVARDSGKSSNEPWPSRAGERLQAGPAVDAVTAR